ncbi:hypothetical protein A7K93_08545 [Candidatus Methylacidiphilum fumarolicum]|nr:hypothetical protein A7K93_08545 [Candidatus Methylacidiphilum fumarolicum]
MVASTAGEDATVRICPFNGFGTWRLLVLFGRAPQQTLLARRWLRKVQGMLSPLIFLETKGARATRNCQSQGANYA